LIQGFLLVRQVVQRVVHVGNLKGPDGILGIVGREGMAPLTYVGTPSICGDGSKGTRLALAVLKK
jgi:hypothetical protein